MVNYEEKAVEYMNRENHKGMIYGVIRHFGISRYSNDYDDYENLGIKLFIKAYADIMQRNPNASEDKIRSFLYQRIRWGILDEIRRQKREESHRADVDDESESDYFAAIPDEGIDAETLVILKDQLRELYLKCSEFERKYLGCKLQGYTEMEISRLLQQTHTRVYRARNTVRRKAREVFDTK